MINYTEIYNALGFTETQFSSSRTIGKKDLVQLFLSTDKDKLQVSIGLDTKYPDSCSLRDYADYKKRDAVNTSINVSTKKPIERIVSEIQKRLLDPNAALIEKATKTINENADRKAYREILIDKLIADNPGIKRSHHYDPNKDEVDLYVDKFTTVRTCDGKSFTPCYYTSLNTKQLLAIIEHASED